MYSFFYQEQKMERNYRKKTCENILHTADTKTMLVLSKNCSFVHRYSTQVALETIQIIVPFKKDGNYWEVDRKETNGRMWHLARTQR